MELGLIEINKVQFDFMLVGFSLRRFQGKMGSKSREQLRSMESFELLGRRKQKTRIPAAKLGVEKEDRQFISPIARKRDVLEWNRSTSTHCLDVG